MPAHDLDGTLVDTVYAHLFASMPERIPRGRTVIEAMMRAEHRPTPGDQPRWHVG